MVRGETTCRGTNVNHNWPASWYDSEPEKYVERYCSTWYRGQKPADTREVASFMRLTYGIIGDSLNEPKSDYIKLFIDFQSGGQRSM